MVVRVEVEGIEEWGTMDTAARSIWVDEAWFRSVGGVTTQDEDGAEGADGRALDVAGKGELSFSLWGCKFTETVRVMRKLPATILIGLRFWRQYALK